MGNICKISATSTRSASPVEDPVTAHRTNALLNRWRSGEVIALQRLFRGAKKRKKDLGLEKAAFVELFPKLHSKALCDAVFSLFDSTGNGSVSFRDFCRALAWCGRGTRAEKLRFLFCLFVIYEQQQQQLRGKSKHADLENGAAASPLAALPAIGGSTAAALPANPNVLTTTTQTTQQQQQQGGLLGGPHQQPQQAPPPPPKQQHHRHTSSSSESTTTAQHQHQHPPTSPKQQQQTTQLLHEELALGDLDDDVDSPRLGILGLDALAHFAGRPPTTAVEDDARLNFKHFVAWADRYLPESVVDDALEPLAVLSTPRSERDAVQAALADADIRPGDAAFVLSKDWWNAWCRYAGYTVPRPPPPKHKGDDDDDEGERRNGAEEQNFNLLSLGLVVDSGKGGSENDDDDDSEDAENAKAAVVVVVDEGTTTKKPPPTTSGAAGNTTNQRDPRPSEMDNSSLLYGSDDEIAPDLSLGVDFVLVPREVWDCFGRWYGGGPALPRTAVDEGTFDLRPLSLRVAACDTRGDLPYFAPRRLERFHVDLDLATLERSEVLLRALFFANGGVTTQGSSSSLNTTSSHHHHHHHHSHRSGKNGHATTTSGGDDDDSSAPASSSASSSYHHQRGGGGGVAGIFDDSARSTTAALFGFGDTTSSSSEGAVELDDLAPGQKRRVAVVAAALFAKAKKNDGSRTLEAEVSEALALSDEDKVAVARRLAELQRDHHQQPRKVSSFISLAPLQPKANRGNDATTTSLTTTNALPHHSNNATTSAATTTTGNSTTTTTAASSSSSPNNQHHKDDDPADDYYPGGGSLNAGSSKTVGSGLLMMSKALHQNGSSPRHRSAPTTKPGDNLALVSAFGKPGERVFRYSKKGAVRLWSRRATGRKAGGGSKKPLPPQRWRLLCSATHRTLGDAGVESLDELMIEFADPVTLEWPRARFVEPPNFRNFRVDDRLDACDYRGRWFPGTVVAVDDYAAERTNVPAARVRVHFDKFPSKWDEWYDVGSANLAPLGTRAVVPRAAGSSTGTSSRAGPGKSAGGGGGGVVNPVVPPPPPLPLQAAQSDSTDAETDQYAESSTHSAASASASQQNPTTTGGPVVAAPTQASRAASEKTTAAGSSSSTTQGNKETVTLTTTTTTTTGGGASAAHDQAPGGYQQKKTDTLPGATGLMNLGNTCFMNSALQCLSHTPLLRAYCLSEGYASEINRTNPLGSQGRMVEEFASVLKQLWSEQYRNVAPSKFKRTLARLKPQFANNDQHDSQEFLAEMLDMLHEDVNRVVEKPYVVEPDDDDVDKLSSVDAAREAWERYLLRNRSVIVDLFQGQLMSERTCETCQKRSLKFETFMYLSVPLPAPRDRPVKLALLRKAVDSKLDPAKLLKTQHTKKKVRDDDHKDKDKAAKVLSEEEDAARGASTSSTSSNPPARERDRDRDREGATPVGRGDKNFADDEETTQQPISTRSSWFGAAPSLRPLSNNNGVVGTHKKTPQEEPPLPRVVKYVFELPRLGTVGDLKQALSEESGIPSSDLVVGDVFHHRFMKVWHDSEPLARVGDDECVAAYECTPEAPAEPEEDPFPSSFEKLEVGTRVDALDLRGHWYIGSVVAIDEGGQRRVSFDRFAPKWDEMYGPEDWDTKLAPPYANSKRRARTLEIQVVHRRERKLPVAVPVGGKKKPHATTAAATRRPTAAAANRRRAPHPRQRVDEDDEDDDYDDDEGDYDDDDDDDDEEDPADDPPREDAADRHHQGQNNGATHDDDDQSQRRGSARDDDGSEDEDRRQRRRVAGPAAQSRSRAYPPQQQGQRRYGDVQHQGVELFGTPFVVRIDSDVAVGKLYAKVAREARNFLKAGCLSSSSSSDGPSSSSEPAAADSNNGSASKKTTKKKLFDVRIAAIGQATTVRWTPPRGRGSLETPRSPGTAMASNHKGAAERQHPFAEAPDILASGSKVLVSDVLDDARAVVTIDWLDPASCYDECFEAEDVARAPSYEEHLDDDGNVKGDSSTVSLASCLDAFSKEDTLSDDNMWFCPKCKVNRHAISRILPWKLPDILVIHMKRFLCSAQWREKINTRVDFPLAALDMSTWVHPDARKHQSGRLTYDLFAVINHLGGMTGGHYTAYVRAVPCSRDGVEEVASSFPTEEEGLVDYRWLHVDDDIVDEVGPHQIVTEAAYVLFYRRRSLTPSTVINLSAFNSNT